MAKVADVAKMAAAVANLEVEWFDTSPTQSVVLMIGLRPGSGLGKLGFRA